MKLNQKLIEQLRNGEIAVENSGTVKKLRKVLKAAFPNNLRPKGDCQYYSRSEIYEDIWTAWSVKGKGKPTFKISDFYQSELFTGWAKDDDYQEWMMYFKNDKAKFGFGTLGLWLGVDSFFGYYSEDETARPATNEEIEKHLSEEANKRGYKKGVTCFHASENYKTTLASNDIEYFISRKGYGVLVMGGYTIFSEKDGQWAEIVEKPKTQPKPIHYLVDGVEYSLDYQDLKSKYQDVVNYSDEVFMANLPQIAHLACVVAYLKGLGVQATISDKGIIHELIHLMTDPDEPTNDLQEIREKFNRLIQLV